MKQQFTGLRHCKSGRGWKRDIGFFERTPDMVFRLRSNALGRPWICCRVWRRSWGACKDKAESEGWRRLPSGGAGARRATERGVLLLCLAIKPLSVIATRCHLSPRRGFHYILHNSKLAKLWIVWYIKHRKRQPPTEVGCRIWLRKIRSATRQSHGAVFLCP